MTNRLQWEVFVSAQIPVVALRITFLLGKHAIFGHDPPIYFRSTTAVRWPACAIVHVRCFPASPLPITRISKRSISGIIHLPASQMAARPPSMASFAP
jgi:hypothetical protein